MARARVVNDNNQETATLLPPVDWLAPELGWVSAVQPRRKVTIDLMSVSAPCGFPSPADDYLDKPLDFNELLIANPSSTFCVKVIGDSMAPVLLPDDLAVVDRSITAADRHIILACLDGSFTIKRLRRKGGRAWLQPENPIYQPTFLSEDSAFEVWGVVWRAVRLF